MSTGLELIPLALAAAGAAMAVARRAERGGAASTPILTVATRLRDERLLARGLSRAGGNPEKRDGVWCGTVNDTPLALTRRTDGTYDAHFDASLDPARAEAVVHALDGAYCAELQQDLYRQVVGRAPERGLSVAEEYEDQDGTLVITLQLEEAEQ